MIAAKITVVVFLCLSVSEATGQQAGLFSLGDITTRYYTNEELDDFMMSFVSDERCSKISRRFSIGQSVLGADLWVLEMSNNPGLQERKPNFKYIANMHGDETNGRQLLIGLARWLCENYPIHPKAKRIVEDMHLFLMPTMNPDGFALGQRFNANSADLNRDFPDRVLHGLPLKAQGTEQPETQAVMDWVQNGFFVASANMHAGALVASFPWDASDDGEPTYAAAPDDETFVHLAKLYSNSHGRMFASKEFKEGITNGNEWFTVHGGMQDWNYLAAGCMEITLELSQQKNPPPSTLVGAWKDNLNAMLNYAIEASFGGLSGTVTLAGSEEPLAASILVEGIDHVVNTRPQFGDYYRPLAPGKYVVIARAEGHQDVTSEVTIPDGLGEGTVRNFIMGV